MPTQAIVRHLEVMVVVAAQSLQYVLALSLRKLSAILMRVDNECTITTAFPSHEGTLRSLCGSGISYIMSIHT